MVGGKRSSVPFIQLTKTHLVVMMQRMHLPWSNTICQRTSSFFPFPFSPFLQIFFLFAQQTARSNESLANELMRSASPASTETFAAMFVRLQGRQQQGEKNGLDAFPALHFFQKPATSVSVA
jgi:hypothetical protein